jgi:hypothetical protein
MIKYIVKWFKQDKNGLSLEKAIGKNPLFTFASKNLRTNLLIKRIFKEVYFGAK